MITCCVFDLDGTLINSLRDLAEATNHALVKNGLPVRKLEDYRYFVGDGVLKLVERAAVTDAPKDLLSQIKQDFDHYYALHYHVYTELYPGISSLLQSLQGVGIRLAVISNKPHEFAGRIVEEFAPGIFDSVLGCSEQFPKKPAPDSLLHTMKILEVSPEECLFIGDSNVDVFTGQNGGVKTVGVTWGFRSREELLDAGADFLADAPSELLQIVNSLSEQA